ncbi:sideroflexin-2-like [Belonocnema kinseyi]|uniref:sideroflexin-2-like n=1 Tax=Belonocnema kinseyi TaxID=2817044 RepID=UPI00143DDB45|nr:sideroflexin-2-like [Belonocnema kinseyi]
MQYVKHSNELLQLRKNSWILLVLYLSCFRLDLLVIDLENVIRNTQRKQSGKSGDFELIDVDKPLWDQETYLGRLRHFAFITDIRTVIVPSEKLLEAKQLLAEYKTGNVDPSITREDIIYAKKLHDSSFHPDNGELMTAIGRMSFQVPGNVILTGSMLTFYKSKLAVVGWQLINQSFNAIVNFTNRNAKSDTEGDDNIIKQAYVGATFASCGAALTFKQLFANKGPLLARVVPFFAVAIGNMVNLPIMRQREITRGIPVSMKNSPENPIIESRIAAVKGISECVMTRIAMAAPGMLGIPVLTNWTKKYCFYQARPWLSVPTEITILALLLLILVPTCLAIYPQRK